MIRLVRAAALAVTAALFAACAGRTVGESSCEGTGRGSDGRCCPAWTRAVDGTCRERAITRPSVLQSLGPAGTRAVVAGVDSNGRALVAWTTDASSRGRLFVAEEQAQGSSVSTMEPSSALAGDAVQPAIATGPDGRAVVAWKNATSPDTSAIHVAERDRDGRWTFPRAAGDALSFAPRGFEPAALITPLGETVLAWNQWFDGESIYGVEVATHLPGAPWTRPSGASDVLSPHLKYANTPRAVASPDGGVLVTWYQAKHDDRLMAWFSERAGASGTFSRATDDDVLSPSGADVGGQGGGSPRPVVGSDGRSFVAWLQGNADAHVRPYLATRERGGAWKKPALDGALGEAKGDARELALAVGAHGTLFFAWTQDEGKGAVLHALARGADGNWREDVHQPPTLSSDGASVTSPVLASGPEGGVVLAWLEVGSGGSALRIRRAWDGAPPAGWGPIETISTPDHAPDSPAVAIGGSPERIVVAFTEGRDARVHIATID